MSDFSAFTTQEKFADEAELLQRLVAQSALSPGMRKAISERAAALVQRIRDEARPTLMEHFLAEYGLSTTEGVALMCLAEAMLRVPDVETVDALIEDKIAPSDWGRHLGTASSSLVNASTWALMLTGRVLDADQPGVAGVLRGAIKRLGEPVIRRAVGRAMKEMGRQFVLGETITEALERAKTREAQGFTYSYDMLGEAARTAADATRYQRDYSDAIAGIAKMCKPASAGGSVHTNPGISVKLSALHPRYEVAREERVMAELVPVLRDLSRQAARANMCLNVDAEEQDRLVLSFKVIAAVLADPELAGWEGFGVVVQGYGKRAGIAIDWLHDLAADLDRRITVRLVKGAYWDAEMKLAQVMGHPGFALFTSKQATDVSYIANAKKLLGYRDRIYPQFATHNAHSVAAILELAGTEEGGARDFEFQRLHGMGERLHDIVLREGPGRCRIYAPVGAHRDLLAYLVRRLLENGANSSFVHQIVDEDVKPEEIAQDPFDGIEAAQAPSGLRTPDAIFGKGRVNAAGFDLSDEQTLARLEAARAVPLPGAGPLTLTPGTGTTLTARNPANGEDLAQVTEADARTVARAIADARPWQAPVAERAEVLRRAADLYEASYGVILAALAREAGKSWLDAVGELREAVDFLRYYAGQAEAGLPAPRGIFAAISPWNFPLAIFTGQIAAALAAGNGVLAKPAEQTPIVAAIATRILHEAGVPAPALQLLPGRGEIAGAALTSDARINGVVFTGSTETARRIRCAMAENLDPGAPLIAETGGLNAMIVDSTALPEQAVRDIVASAFQSAGQRCSALRCLYLQEDIAPHVIGMIKGAMDELTLGDPWDLAVDVGPVIDAEARADIAAYLEANKTRILHQLSAPQSGHFIAPSLLRVSGIKEVEREIFGPVLHVATFRAQALDQVVADVNASGHGLTFGLHTRIDNRVQEVAETVEAGNIYVNRNQIGAVVGSQPFGGEGLSGTGPKAGGPLYLLRFCQAEKAGPPPMEQLMPGPTGELNRLTLHPRAPILCLGPDRVEDQISAVQALGGRAMSGVGIAPGELATRSGISGAIWWGDVETARAMAQALASRRGPILPLITGFPDVAHAHHERHLCIDTTAAGGNAALLAG